MLIDTTPMNYTSLEAFGLSTYEAKVYMTMLSLGLSTAKKISDESTIPFGRIYDVLTSLENKGMLDKQDSRPKKYSVRPPKIALKNLLVIKEEEFNSLTLRANAVEEQLSRFYVKNPDEGLFWSVALEEETILRHTDKVLETERELLIFLNVQIQHQTLQGEGEINFINTLKRLLEREINIKILLGGVTDITQIEKLAAVFTPYIEVLEKIEIRMTPITTNTFDIIDEEKVILKISNPVKLEEYFALIYVWQKKFAKQLKKKFSEIWRNADEINNSSFRIT